MKALIVLAIVFFFCGCFAIVDEDNKVKGLGVNAEDVLDTIQQMDEKKEEGKYHTWSLRKRLEEREEQDEKRDERLNERD